MKQENKQCCSGCIFYNGEIGDGKQFCDYKEVFVSEHSWCAQYRPNEYEDDLK